MEFNPERKKVLFFSRGRGSGHAIADIEIARELGQIRTDAQVRFVSYGTGARTLRERDVEVIDLGLPDANSIAATTVLAGRVIGRLQPDLVVAHEEFAALPPAKIFGKRTVLITDFFGDAGMFSTESLWFADQVLFLDRKGVFAEPPSAKGRVCYVGPVLREFEYGRRDRRRAREELGLDPTAKVVGVFPGSWTEAMAPLALPMLEAFDGAGIGGKHLIWVAGQDAGTIRKLTATRRDVTVLEREWQIERLMVASDLAITKTNRMTVRELAFLGIRTLSISYGLNPADDRCVARLQSNCTVGIAKLNGRLLRRMLRLPEPRPLRPRSRSCGEELARMLE